jgi:hypothetical protein
MKRLAAALAAMGALAWVIAAPAMATDNGATYNNQFTTANVSDCVPTNSNSGIAGFGFYDGSYMPFSLNTASSPCGTGYLRIMTIQRLTVGNRLTYINRGGGPGEQATVHVAASDLRSQPALNDFSVRNGNGRFAPGCTFGPIYTYPQGAGMPGDMLYKNANEGGQSGSNWANYGDPGARYGSHYNYLLWNMPRRDTGSGEAVLPGGGLVMAVMKQRTPVYACDVSQQYLDSFPAGSNTPNGWTRWAYVRVGNTSGETLYGWFLVSYSYHGGAEVFAFTWT